jgi:hypothetical protein
LSAIAHLRLCVESCPMRLARYFGIEACAMA